MTFSDDRYDQMTYRRCGTSGLMLPGISLGCWQNFGDSADQDVARAMLRRAFDLGVTHFDLANNYGPPAGSAESNVGRYLKEDFAAHRDELIISSKAGYRMWPGPYGVMGSRKYLIASCDASLKRLGLGYVDIFYSHRFDPDTPLAETIGGLDQIVRSGKAIYVGISSYSGAMTMEAHQIAERLGTPLIIHQPSYHMLNRYVETDLLPVTERIGMGVIAFCPLAQGLLTDKYLDGIPEGSRAADKDGLAKKASNAETLQKIRALNDHAQQRGQTLAQMALQWLLRDDRMTSALIGASKVSQIEENVAALDGPAFDADELKKIDEILER